MNAPLRSIESVWYTPDETVRMLKSYEPTGQFHVFVFLGVEVPFTQVFVRIGMATIRDIRAGYRDALGAHYRLSDFEEQEMIKAFMVAARSGHTLAAATPIWLLAQNSMPGLAEIEAVPEKDCISIRIVFEGDTNIHTVFSQFTIDELMASAEAAVAKGKPF